MKLILEKMKVLSSERKWFEPDACFAAGTLVHTKEGLVAIEKIKVGDWVLSKPENGGEQAYRRVLKTFAHEPTTVMEVKYQSPEDENIGNRIISTLNHPFWIVDQGWTAASEIPEFSYRDAIQKFELSNGSRATIAGRTPIYTSEQNGVGWRPGSYNDPEKRGALWDYLSHTLIETDVFALDSIREGEMEDPYLKLPVYNLEVEDFHTYYVGQHGVWVHNTNCDGFEAP